MSLTTDGVWKANVWASTVWGQDVWFEGVVSPAQVHPPGTSKQKRLQQLIMDEDELLLAVITAFLHIKDD